MVICLCGSRSQNHWKENVCLLRRTSFKINSHNMDNFRNWNMKLSYIKSIITETQTRTFPNEIVINHITYKLQWDGNRILRIWSIVICTIPTILWVYFHIFQRWNSQSMCFRLWYFEENGQLNPPYSTPPPPIFDNI